MSYILLSLLAASFFALSMVVNKFVSRHRIENRDALMMYFMLASSAFAVLLFPFTSRTVPDAQTLGSVFIATATFLVGYYLFFLGIRDTDASVFAPLFQLQAALVALLAFLFLGERFPPANYLWVLVIMLGVVFVSTDEKSSLRAFLKPGVKFILAMQVLHAVSNLFVGFSLREIGFVDMLFWEYVVIGLLALPFYAVTKPSIGYPTRTVVPFFIATSLSAIGALCLFSAFKQNLTVSSTLSLMSSPMVFLITVLASRFRPEWLEHHTAKIYLVRGFGLLIILLGAIQLSLS